MKKIELVGVSVSSRSYILSYIFIANYCLEFKEVIKFPSPLGVIFSLMN